MAAQMAIMGGVDTSVSPVARSFASLYTPPLRRLGVAAGVAAAAAAALYNAVVEVAASAEEVEELGELVVVVAVVVGIDEARGVGEERAGRPVAAAASPAVSASMPVGGRVIWRTAVGATAAVWDGRLLIATDGRRPTAVSGCPAGTENAAVMVMVMGDVRG